MNQKHTKTSDLVDTIEDLNVELLILTLQENDKRDFQSRIFNEIAESRIEDH